MSMSRTRLVFWIGLFASLITIYSFVIEMDVEKSRSSGSVVINNNSSVSSNSSVNVAGDGKAQVSVNNNSTVIDNSVIAVGNGIVIGPGANVTIGQ